MVLADGQMGIYAGQKSLVLGLDPGRDKTGFAFVNFSGELILSGIFPTSEREKFFAGHYQDYVIEGNSSISLSNVKFIALGNGTNSKEFHEYVKSKVTCEIIIVDEKNTTLDARKLYWKIHKPGFFAKLLPENLRVPKRVLDDLAAWEISLRALNQNIEI